MISSITYVINELAMINLVRCTRGTEEESDRFIFDLFNLNPRFNEISKEALTTMLYNLPSSGLISPWDENGKHDNVPQAN